MCGSILPGRFLAVFEKGSASVDIRIKVTKAKSYWQREYLYMYDSVHGIAIHVTVLRLLR